MKNNEGVSMESEIYEPFDEPIEPAASPAVDAAPAPPPPLGGGLTNEQRTFALCAYLIPLVTSSGFIAPLIIWLLKKGEDPYVENHARESLNLQITFVLCIVVAWMSVFALIGILLFPAVIITYIVFSIVAGIKAYKGEEYKIPVCIRFIQ
jgi:uncharacterized Tic20 family protein